jgi:hypothetical protein
LVAELAAAATLSFRAVDIAPIFGRLRTASPIPFGPRQVERLRRAGLDWEEPSEEEAKRLDEAYRSGEF